VNDEAKQCGGEPVLAALIMRILVISVIGGGNRGKCGIAQPDNWVTLSMGQVVNAVTSVSMAPTQPK
jgi:hypothetical protein